ncbi:MAG: DUF4838 domain-containing protein [Clostridiales bacterium]|nr:DUF4838 domain-containing protein [Clostridiales bacterium]
MTSLLIHPEEISKKWIDRLVESKIDCLGIHPVGGYRAHINLEVMLKDMKTEKFRNLLDYALEKGLRIEYEMHCGSYLMPRDLFDTHPEYFRMNEEGTRTSDMNFCVSNKGALKLVAKRARELANSLYKSTHNFYFWLDDKKDSHCHCPECSKYSASDQQMIVMNEILKEIQKDIPDAKLAYLAYFNTSLPPKKIRPDKGIFVEYAPMERDMKKPSSDVPDKEKELQADLLNTFGKTDSKVLEYWYDNSMFSNWTKPPKKYVPDFDLISKSVDYYKSAGFENISSFACYLGEDYEELYGDFGLPVLEFGE